MMSRSIINVDQNIQNSKAFTEKLKSLVPIKATNKKSVSKTILWLDRASGKGARKLNQDMWVFVKDSN